MSEKPTDYLSYLLRLWRVDNGQESDDALVKPGWRASLESSLGGERQGFASLDELFDFLRQQTGAMLDEDRDSAGSSK